MNIENQFNAWVAILTSLLTKRDGIKLVTRIADFVSNSLLFESDPLDNETNKRNEVLIGIEYRLPYLVEPSRSGGAIGYIRINYFIEGRAELLNRFDKPTGIYDNNPLVQYIETLKDTVKTWEDTIPVLKRIKEIEEGFIPKLPI